MNYTFSKNIDYSKVVPSGEYEVQISKLEVKPISYKDKEGNEVNSEVLSIELTIRDDWNENPKETQCKKLYDSAFRRTNGLFDEKVLGQIVNAIPRKDDDIDFNEENLLAYLKGACVRITLKYTTNKKGKQVKVIDYEQSRMTNKKLTANENNEEIEVINDDDLPF